MAVLVAVALVVLVVTLVFHGICLYGLTVELRALRTEPAEDPWSALRPVPLVERVVRKARRRRSDEDPAPNLPIGL